MSYYKGPSAKSVRRFAIALVVAMLAGSLSLLAVNLWERIDEGRAPEVGIQEGTVAPPLVEPVSPSVAPKIEYKSTLRPRLGRDLLVIRIPKFNKSWTVKEGVRLVDIKNNPGHYPGTAMPGEAGNFSVAGHRIRRIFWRLNEMHVGDTIEVRAENKVFTYRVYQRRVIKPTEVLAVWPVPYHPELKASRKLITLTTCLKTGHEMREVVHGELISMKAE